jgi:hypothetical protein
MKRYFASLNNEKGSALLVIVLLVPVLTLFCILASNVSVQNQTVATADKCHQSGLFAADGAVYGTAALISQIGKNYENPRAPVQDGTEAPGIQYVTNAANFAAMLSSNASASTTEDVMFLKTPNDFGVQSTVDMQKLPGGNLAGGGAEFGNSAEGIGSQITVVVFRLRSTGISSCTNTNVQVNGDYWMIVSKGAQTKGI